ncbi:TonB-dependent receptor domain-containing protein [Chitinophaga sp. MM2321]|uniref:TonB-dependent receptor n=1 Tax=Chitinophaga sp. MM2321 TaxID=3137178 RepID=UPI0032D5845C
MKGITAISVQIWILTVFTLIANVALAGDPAKLTGKVTDKKTGEALIGVTIVVQGTGKGAVTDVEGRYSMIVEPGTYTINFKYIGYQTKSVSEVAVKPTAPTQLNIIMDEPKSEELREVVIRGSFKQETINALYAAQKNSAVVSDGISADLIKKSPDKNTGEVLKRVSGTSIQDNKFVVVRGLGDRYNTTLMNSSVLPSTEPDKKAFAFDIIPANLIDNITIYKTASPDLPGDFSGGAIKVSTKDFPDQQFLELTLGTGYNTQTTFKDFYSGPPKGKFDFIGFDDGSRKLPAAYSNVKNNYTNLETSQKIAISKNFSNTYGETKDGQALPPLSVQLSMGNSWTLKNNRRFGYIFAVNYGNSQTLRFKQRDAYLNTKEHTYSYHDEIYGKNRNLGSVLNLAYTYGKSKLSWKNFYNNDFNVNFTRRNGFQYDGTNLTTGVYSLNNETTQNGLFNSVLEGQHRLKSEKLRIDWNAAYGRSYRNQPDQRILAFFQRNPDQPFFLHLSNENSPAVNSAGRVFSNLKENIFSGNLNFTMPFKLLGESQQFKFGGGKVYRDRDFSVVALGYASNANGGSGINIDLDKDVNPGNIFSNANLDKYSIFLARIDMNTKDYEGIGDLSTGYLMLDNRLTNNIRLVWGARIENYHQQLKAVNQKTQDYNNTDVLPSANLTIGLSEQTNLRASFSKSVNRAEFRELASFRYYDYENEFIISGNPDLQRSINSNADLKFEFFPGAGEVLSASLFYKKFKNPIEQVNKGNDVLSFSNADAATDFGGEIELRKNLGFISQHPVFQGLTFYTNAALIHSSVDLQGVNKKTPLQGQSPYLVNGGLTYASSNNGFSMNLLYNRIGQRLRFRGEQEGLDTYEKPRDVVDFQISKKLFGNAGELKLSIADIFAQPVALYYKYPGSDKTAYNAGNDKVINAMKPGTTFSVSFRYNFMHHSSK